MFLASKTYHINSHNSYCAQHKGLGMLLKEIYGKDHVRVSEFLTQEISINGFYSDNPEPIGIAIVGENITVNKKRDENGRFVDIPSKKVGRVFIKLVKSGNFKTPYVYDITVEFESKEGFLEKIEKATLNRKKDDVVDFSFVEEGDEIRDMITGNVVKITAIGVRNFLAISAIDEEHSYAMEKNWVYCEDKK